MNEKDEKKLSDEDKQKLLEDLLNSKESKRFFAEYFSKNKWQ